jgi:hypothetical protein
VKNKLLKSFTFIFVFWWLAVYLFWYATLEPIHSVLRNIFIDNEFESIAVLFEPVTISLAYWSIPVLILLVSVAILTFLSINLFVYFSILLKEKRLERNKDKQWNGMKISLGELPSPSWKPDIPKYKPELIQEYIDESIQKHTKPNSTVHVFGERYSRLLSDILFFIWSNNDAFVGDGHGVSLWEHTLDVLERSWPHVSDPLIPIAAAAHDAGKILAWERHPKSGEWKRVGYHDDYGMLLVSSLDSFFELELDEQLVLKMVIGYGHKENKRPILETSIDKRVESIFKIINKSDRQQTAKEKQKLLEKESTTEVLTKAFLDAVMDAPFNTKDSAVGEASVCFRKGSDIYLLEPGFRDIFLQFLPPDVAAAFGKGFKRIGNMSPPTVALINHLKNIGWLVESGNGMQSECGLWSVEIGKKVFNGVLAIRLPEKFCSELPDDTIYDIRFSCPLKVKAGQDMKPADRISPEEMSSLQKKARALSAITNVPYEACLKDMIEKSESKQKQN